MNKMFKYIGCALAAALVIFACSPDEFEGANENGLPTVSGRSIVVDTDQTTNTATFYVTGDMTGCYPVWYLDDSNYSILPTASYTSLSAGTHTLKAYLLNRNGVSQAALEASFTFENTITDYTTYYSRLCEKEWRIDYSEVAHMACGDTGSDGTGWWSASVNEKADFGVYDDRVTFTHSDSDGAAEGTYTYDPGEGGTVYVNYNTTSLNTTGATEDFMMSVSSQTAGFELVDGTYNGDDCLYIQFDPYTYLPYIPNDNTWANPYYRIESVTNTRLVLVCDDGSIAWRLVFTSRDDTGSTEDENDAVMDWDYSSSKNLWAPVDAGTAFDEVFMYFATGDNWADNDNATYTHTDGDDEWSIVLPDNMGTSQWQAQFHIKTTLGASGSQAYNFYLVMEANNDITPTIKFTDSSDDNNYFFAESFSVTADKENVFKAEGVTLALGEAADSVKLVFDFAGAPDGTEIKVSNIYWEEAISYSDDANMWKAVDAGTAFKEVTMYFAIGDSWADNDNATYTHTDDVWSIVLPASMGTSQWQGQFLIWTTLSASMNKTYTFSCKIKADNDLSQMTIKLTDSTNSGNYFFDDRHDFLADTENVYKVTGAVLNSSDIDGTLQLVFDFGGSPGGTTVTISEIIFAEE